MAKRCIGGGQRKPRYGRLEGPCAEIREEAKSILRTDRPGPSCSTSSGAGGACGAIPPIARPLKGGYIEAPNGPQLHLPYRSRTPESDFDRMIFLLLLLLGAAPVRGSETGALAGHVVDAESGEAVGWTTVVVEGLERARISDADGYFFFANLPSGIHVLQTLHVGYHEARFEVEVAAGDTNHVDLAIGHHHLELQSIIIEGRSGRPLSPLETPEVVFSGSTLRQNLSRTIAETIDSEPGIALRSMGPAPARPVLRGLGGDRLLVLEDGERTGDLSASSSDHAVAIEPLTTERIEVVRGPRTLLYGSNALAGVVNVVRGYVPSDRSEGLGGSFTWQGESVNGALGAGLSLEHPLGPMALRADGSWRNASDIATPRGVLPNTDIRTGNASAGISLVRSWGHAGVSGSLYDSDYGIPPDPQGGHPHGVSIELERQHLEGRGELLGGPDWLQRLELSHAFSRYQHGEFEVNHVLGLEFGVLSHHSSVLAHLSPMGPMRNGAMGLWYEYRNYAAAGLDFTPPAEEYAGALFTYQEIERGPWSANAALRADARRVEPREEKVSRTVGRIRTRDFAGLSAGLSSHYRAGHGLTLGATLMRTFRAPGIEELFSEGPHLAAYSYEVGSGDLNTERGLGLELFADHHHERGPSPPGPVPQRHRRLHLPEEQRQAQPEARRPLPLPDGGGARPHARRRSHRRLAPGAALENRLLTQLRAAATWPTAAANPCRACRPLQSRISLAWEPTEALSAGGALRLAADQNRPGEFEEPTEGYAVLDLSGKYYVHLRGHLHTFALTLENATDAVYRNHLNRVKEILPEPGRNLRLLHKVFF